jgi:hypothetical protein
VRGRFLPGKRRGASAAYLLNEADLAPCGRDSALFLPLVSASVRLRIARPQVGVRLILRPVDSFYEPDPEIRKDCTERPRLR